jgi:Cu/Ag efflux protein CusF
MKTSAVSAVSTHLWAVLFALLPLAAGCSRSEEARRGNTYTMRAQVEGTPAQGSREVYVTHEPIDNYVGREGKVKGMDSMTMPFQVAEGVSLEGIESGDVIEAQLHVDWEADLPVQITGIRELPRDTPLHFGEAKPQPHNAEEGH